MRLLILGGTTEASQLATAMVSRMEIAATLSLAGRTAEPAPLPIPVRSGGFGGPEGLASYLQEHAIDAVIDATHPFAARISANAVAACRSGAVPLVAFSRPPWRARMDDSWTPVADIAAAVRHLTALPPRAVFLTTGRLDLAAFKGAPQHRYLVRTIDPPALAQCPPDTELILGRGPFGLQAERALMREQDVALLVSKNSGGAASAAKLEAARSLGVPVLMVERPAVPSRPVLQTLDDVLGWIEAHRPHR